MLVLLTNAGWPPHLAPPELLPFHDSQAVQRNANNTAKDGVALYCIQMQKKKRKSRKKNAKQQKTIYSHWRWRRRRRDVTTKGVLINI